MSTIQNGRHLRARRCPEALPPRSPSQPTAMASLSFGGSSYLSTLSASISPSPSPPPKDKSCILLGRRSLFCQGDLFNHLIFWWPFIPCYHGYGPIKGRSNKAVSQTGNKNIKAMCVSAGRAEGAQRDATGPCQGGSQVGAGVGRGRRAGRKCRVTSPDSRGMWFLFVGLLVF